MTKNHNHLTSWLIAFLGMLLLASPGKADLLDSWVEDFDNRMSNTSIQGIDDWEIYQGLQDDVMIQSDVNYGGSGKALKISGDTPIMKLGRPFEYGKLSPTWIKFRIRPSMAEENPDVPTKGIGSVCFDYTGKILVSDGDKW